jgi:hypothetical protein
MMHAASWAAAQHLTRHVFAIAACDTCKKYTHLLLQSGSHSTSHCSCLISGGVLQNSQASAHVIK